MIVKYIINIVVNNASRITIKGSEIMKILQILASFIINTNKLRMGLSIHVGQKISSFSQIETAKGKNIIIFIEMTFSYKLWFSKRIS